VRMGLVRREEAIKIQQLGIRNITYRVSDARCSSETQNGRLNSSARRLMDKPKIWNETSKKDPHNDQEVIFLPIFVRRPNVQPSLLNGFTVLYAWFSSHEDRAGFLFWEVSRDALSPGYGWLRRNKAPRQCPIRPRDGTRTSTTGYGQIQHRIMDYCLLFRRRHFLWCTHPSKHPFWSC
jgi:hypothetical protein